MLVAGAGTGGTITGIARKLKERCPNVKVRCHIFLILFHGREANLITFTLSPYMDKIK